MGSGSQTDQLSWSNDLHHTLPHIGNRQYHGATRPRGASAMSAKSPSRRRAILAAGLATLLGAVTAAVVIPMTSAQAASTLDQLAKAKGLKYFGSATDNPEQFGAEYVRILGSEF